MLSKELLDANVFTPVTVVPASQLIDRFLQEVEAASQQAMQNDIPVLVLVFCRGIGNWEFLLNADDRSKRLSVARLYGALANNCQATLYSSASYSGGWIVRNLSKPENSVSANSTTLNAVDLESVCNAWKESPSIGRICGSMFFDAVTETLISSTSPLLDDGDGDLYVDKEEEEQLAPYSAFCHSILNVCSSRVTGLTFSRQDDQWDWSWTERTGVPLEYFKERWDALPACPVPYDGAKPFVVRRHPSYLDPESSLIHNQTDNKVAAMAQTFLLTCPESWSSGWGSLSSGCLRAFIDKRDLPPCPEVDIAEMMAFRWEASMTADYLVGLFGLRAPNDETCLMWNRFRWLASARRKLISNYGEIYSVVWSALVNGVEDVQPSDLQGPPFVRFCEYLTTAVAASDLGRDGAMKVARQMVKLLNSVSEFTKHRNLSAVLRDESVIQTGRDLFQVLGRKFRLP